MDRPDARDLFSADRYQLMLSTLPSALSSLAAYRVSVVQQAGHDARRKLQGTFVTGNFFQTLKSPTYIGRPITGVDAEPSSPPVAVISSRLWRSLDTGSRSPADVLGSSVVIDGMPRTVIGIMPPSFDFPLGTDVWLPVLRELAGGASAERTMAGVGRLTPGHTLTEAQQAFSREALQYQLGDSAANEGRGIVIRELRDDLKPTKASSLWLITGVVACCLLIGCGNVASLLMVRAAGRTHEMAVRVALGASRRQVFEQLVIEGLLLAVVSACLGVLAAATFGHLAQALLLDSQGGGANGMSFVVLAFVALTTLATGFLFGIVPAAQLTQQRIEAVLRENAANLMGRARARAREVFVIAQVSTTVVLLTAAITLAKSALNVQKSESGMNLAHLYIGSIPLDDRRFDSAAARREFARELDERIASSPVFQSAALMSTRAPRLGKPGAWLALPDNPHPPLAGVPMFTYDVTPGFFQTMGMHLSAGRLFTPSDNASAPSVAVINREMAARLWPHESPLGKQVLVDVYPGDWTTVVGVVDNTELIWPGGAISNFRFSKGYRFPFLFRPMLQVGSITWGGAETPHIDAVIRAVGSAGAERALSETIRQIDPLMRPEPLSPYAAFRSDPRLIISARLISVFSGGAVLLAMLGVFGVVQEMVQRRTPELGLRLVLGASPLAVGRNVVVEAMRLAALGIAGGLLAYLVLADTLERIFFATTENNPQGMLFGVSGGSMGIMLSVILIVFIVVCVAAIQPLVRTMRIQPTVALRS